jgi:uncharacterized membrane protein
MQSKVKLLGHPLHQMLVVFPLGLLGASVVFDLAYRITRLADMALVAHWMIVSGLIGGLLAAPFGFIDWLAIPKRTRARFIGALHGVGNLLVMLFFLASWLARRDAPEAPSAAAGAAGVVGVALSLVTAWLGGELVDRLGIGVYDDAHPNAPSSLEPEKASARRPMG